MIDFNSLIGLEKPEVKFNLEKLYRELDVKGTHTEPRPVQREAMEVLTNRYDERDLILKVSTGAGKTTIGLLYLYAFLRTEQEPVAYICTTIQLVEQVLAEAQCLGIPAKAYLGGTTYPPAECVRGEAILVCTYDKLFNAKSTFHRADVNLSLNAIVLDDAHAGVENIRKQFTVSVSGEIHENLLRIFSPSCSKYHATRWQDIKCNDPHATLEIPHWIWADNYIEVQSTLNAISDSNELIFVWDHIKDILPLCRCVISGRSAEICPDVLPTDQVRAFQQAKHRLFMSATLNDDSLLTRDLGISASSACTAIIPPSDRGLGERMILAPALVDPDLDRGYIMRLCADLSQTHNVVVLTSSSQLAFDWIEAGAQFFSEHAFSDGVEKLRNPASGLRFAVFAQRFDGIDLPDDACRILVIDGLPQGSGLIDKADSELSIQPGGIRNRTIFRIEQGMGRPVRSHADFAVVLLSGIDLATYVGRRDVLESMTQESRNQLNLCVELSNLLKKSAISGGADNAIRRIIDQCLRRDPSWKNYYNHKIRDSKKADVQIDRERIAFAESERQCYLRVTNNDIVGGLKILNSALAEIKLDELEKGVYLQRISRLTYLIDQVESMKIQYRAREANRALAIPPTMPRRVSNTGTKTVAEKFLTWYTRFANPNAAVLEARRIADSLDLDQPPKKVEAALMKLGEALGADSTRPDEDFNIGPDNLWLWGNQILVIEAKSGNEKSLHKKDSGQIHDSLQWTQSIYPDRIERLQPLIVARVFQADRDANFPANTMVLNQEGCTEIGRSFVQMIQKLANMGPVFETREIALNEIMSFGLHPTQFISKYTRKISKL